MLPTQIVGLQSAFFGCPGHLVLVGKDGGGDGATIVTTKAYQHDTELWYLVNDICLLN